MYIKSRNGELVECRFAEAERDRAGIPRLRGTAGHLREGIQPAGDEGWGRRREVTRRTASSAEDRDASERVAECGRN